MTILFRPRLVFLFHHIAIPHDFLHFTAIFRNLLTAAAAVSGSKGPSDSASAKLALSVKDRGKSHSLSSFIGGLHPFERHRGDRQVSKADDAQKDLISFRNAKIIRYS